MLSIAAPIAAVSMALCLAVIYANLPSRNVSLLILAADLMLAQLAMVASNALLSVACPMGYDGAYAYQLAASGNATMADGAAGGLDGLDLSAGRVFCFSVFGSSAYAAALAMAVDLYRRVGRLEDQPARHAVLREVAIAVVLPLPVTIADMFWEADFSRGYAGRIASDVGLAAIALASAVYTTLAVVAFCRRRSAFSRLVATASDQGKGTGTSSAMLEAEQPLSPAKASPAVAKAALEFDNLFWRVMWFCLIEVICTLPFAVFVLGADIVTIPPAGYSADAAKPDDESSDNNVYVLAASSLLVFGCFGTGEIAIKRYRGLWQTLFGRLRWPAQKRCKGLPEMGALTGATLPA
ncbi:hypothetical protein HK101_009090, partial [Irineochytrium annulatum]